MRKCTRFHWEDLERGDVIIYSFEDEDEDFGVKDFEGVVTRTYNTQNFGPAIVLSSINGVEVKHPDNQLYLYDVETVKLKEQGK